MPIDHSVISGPDATLETATTQFVEANGIRFAYRTIGPARGVPLVLLQHFTGTIDQWDPAVVNGLARGREVIVFDNAGIGGSSGQVPDNVEQMSDDALAFIGALGHRQVDLLGYSLGGMVAQVLAARHPALVRKIILANTAHQGGGNDLMRVLQEAMSQKTHADPRMVLFFNDSAGGVEAGREFLKRVGARQTGRDPGAGPEVAGAQAKALIEFTTKQDPSHALLRAIAQPVLIVTGSNDTMLPTDSSYAMFKTLASAQLVMYPDSNHGAIFQYHDRFVTDVESFLSR